MPAGNSRLLNLISLRDDDDSFPSSPIWDIRPGSMYLWLSLSELWLIKCLWFSHIFCLLLPNGCFSSLWYIKWSDSSLSSASISVFRLGWIYSGRLVQAFRCLVSPVVDFILFLSCGHRLFLVSNMVKLVLKLKFSSKIRILFWYNITTSMKNFCDINNYYHLWLRWP